MATVNKDIAEIVKKSKILLLDIEGTTTSISFVKDKLFPYAEENVKQFLDSQWENSDVKDAVSALRKLAIADQESTVEGVVAIPGEDASKEDQIEGLVKSVKWQMSADRKAGALKQLQGLIWKQGYDNGDIKGHVYDDVSAALEAWRAADGRKVYIYSSGSVQAQKLLFGQSLAGDLLKFIDGHFDTAVGAKQEEASYKQIVEKIGCQPGEILFLTDIVKEGEAARAAGLNVGLVSREGNAPLPEEAVAAFPVLHSLAELTPTNKRKPEPQEEAPAKVMKTANGVDVKTASEAESVEVAATEKEEPEKMEVEEAATKDVKDAPVVEEIKVEEMTEAEAESVTGVEPVAEPKVVEEIEDKTETNETEMKSPDLSEDKKENKENGAATTEESPPVVVTEIEDISEKALPDEAEVIEDIIPVVEEPVADMEELQNVGDVLEKECDEILSKVQDVTNLDNIPVKPLLNTIAEETMETENTDSNDIVDRILDSELDLEMKQCADIDLNTVSEMTDEMKTEGLETNGVKGARDVPDQVTEIKEVVDKKVEDSSPKEPEVLNNEANEMAQKNETEKEAVPNDVKASETVSAAVSNEANEPELNNVKAVEEPKTPAVETTAETPEATSDTPVADAPVVEETKPTEPAAEESKVEKDAPEPQLNGKAVNGDAAMEKRNGDVSKDEEVNERLSVENGKVNGSNGDSMDATEQGQGDCKIEAEVTDIKVKTVATDEPRTDPIEQSTEA